MLGGSDPLFEKHDDGKGGIDPEKLQAAISSAVADAVKAVIPEIVKQTQAKASAEIKEAIAPLAESMNAFNAIVKDVAENDEGDDDDEDGELLLDDDDDGEPNPIKQATGQAMKKVQEKFNRDFNEYKVAQDARLTDLQSQLDQERAEKETIKQKTISQKVKSELTSALSELKVVSVDGGIKWFQDNTKLDPNTDTVVYVDKDGIEKPLVDGIKANMPEWLKGAAGRPGASTNGGSPENGLRLEDPNPINTKIESLAKEIDQAKVVAETSGQDVDIARVQILSNKLQKLQAEAAKSPNESSQI
jgi:hypothetical protein